MKKLIIFVFIMSFLLIVSYSLLYKYAKKLARGLKEFNNFNTSVYLYDPVEVAK